MTNYILFGTPLSEALALLNALISSIIVVRLATYQRKGASHRAWGGWLAWALMVLYGYFPIQLACGAVVVIGWTQIAINGIFMVAIIRLKGNVVQLFKMAGSTR